MNALVWLQQHNEFYKDIVIDSSKLDKLPVDGSVEEEMVSKSANFIQLDETAVQEGSVSEDIGPAPSQMSFSSCQCRLGG